MPVQGVRRAKGGAFQWVQAPPDNRSSRKQSDHMEVTKWLKPSISVSQIGNSASVQAATRKGQCAGRPDNPVGED